MKRLRIHSASIVTYFSILLTSIYAQVVPQASIEGDRLRMGYVYSRAVSFNPMLSLSEYNDEINDLVFGDGLFVIDENGRINNGLALVSGQEDERIWNVTLPSDLKFHDRSSLTISDVIFSFNLYKKFALQSSRLYMVRYLKSVERLDANTVRFVLQYPVENFRETLGQLPILPERHYQEWLKYDKINDLPEVIPPVGMGAFIFRPYLQKQIYLDANKFYFRKKPNLEGIDIHLFESYEDLLDAYVHDGIDLMEVSDKNIYRKINQITNEVKFTWVKRDNLKLYYILFNTQRTPFNELNIRRALTQAVNKNLLVNRNLPDKSQVASNVLNKYSRYYFFEADKYRYDPLSTMVSLESAGYSRQRNGKLFRDGKELKFDLYFERGSAFEESLIRLISINMGELGINVQPRPLRPPELEERMIEGNYQAILHSFVYDPQNSEQVPRQFYLEEINRINGFQNFNERRINAVIDRSEKAFRMNELLPNLQRIQYLLNEYAPCIFLFFENRTYFAINDRFENIKVGFLENQEYQTKLTPKYVWYVPKDKQKY